MKSVEGAMKRETGIRLVVLLAAVVGLPVGANWTYYGDVDELRQTLSCVVERVGETALEDVWAPRIWLAAEFKGKVPAYSVSIALDGYWLERAKKEGTSYELPTSVELLSGAVQLDPAECSNGDCKVKVPLADLDSAAPKGELRMALDVLVKTQNASSANGWKDRYAVREAVFTWDFTHWTYAASMDACVKVVGESEERGFLGLFD